MSRDEPGLTVLARLPPADPNTIGLAVIDGATWDRLAALVGLPMAARFDLVKIVLEERVAWRRWKRRPQQPTEAGRELKRLRGLAKKLADGLRGMGIRSQDAVVGARSEESDVQQFTRLARYDKRLLETDSVTIERWCARLDRAANIAKGERGCAGPDRSLRRLIGQLDALLQSYNKGGGLKRAFYVNRPSRSTAAAHKQFVSEIVQITLGKRQPSTVDDAMKDIIAARRRAQRKAPGMTCTR
jgi:hypothetical protein